MNKEQMNGIGIYFPIDIRLFLVRLFICSYDVISTLVPTGNNPKNSWTYMFLVLMHFSVQFWYWEQINR